MTPAELADIKDRIRTDLAEQLELRAKEQEAQKMRRAMVGIVLSLFAMGLPYLHKAAADWWDMPITWESAYIRAGYFLLTVIYVFGKWR